jgi:hypothetical protein
LSVRPRPEFLLPRIQSYLGLAYRHCLEIMACGTGAQGRAQSAAQSWGAVEAPCEEIGVLLKSQERKLLDPYPGAVRTGLSAVAWHVALTEERAMMPEQARHEEIHQNRLLVRAES